MLDQYLAEHPTSVGVLTVPQSVALSTAQRLIAGGVKGLWNFTNIELGIRAPGVVVENVHFAELSAGAELPHLPPGHRTGQRLITPQLIFPTLRLRAAPFSARRIIWD